MRPSDYPPPVQEGEFVVEPRDDEDTRLDVGVLFVGAGPASLAGAIRLAQLLETREDLKESLGEMPVVVIEKGRSPGAHLLSGAVVDPIAFRQLFPDMKMEEFPFFGPVEKEAVYYLTRSGSFRVPTPPTMANHGNWVASLSQVGRWLGEKAEALGVTILPETSATHLLVKDGRVQGVRVGDKGVDRDGQPQSNHEPGPDLVAPMTVLGEGVVGHLTQAALERFGIQRPNPQIYALGVKEVWDVKKPLDRVIHTMGWPLRAAARYREFGGSFCYPMGPDKVSIGLVVGLDYADSSLSTHDLFQEMKQHPLFRGILEGGRRLERGWGAKSIPEGGLFSLPDHLSVPGCVFVGDAAGFVNVPTLKGIHYAMWSGILAAEAIFERIVESREAVGTEPIHRYDELVRKSFIHRDLHEVRNMRQAFRYGFFPGAVLAGIMTLTRGVFPGGMMKTEPDSHHEVLNSGRTYAKADGERTFDKLSSVHASGNKTRDDQPNHIRVRTDVPEELARTWIQMCPAQVYEWREEAGTRSMIVNAPNCIHCDAITAKGGRLTPPEGGSGPEYTIM